MDVSSALILMLGLDFWDVRVIKNSFYFEAKNFIHLLSLSVSVYIFVCSSVVSSNMYLLFLFNIILPINLFDGICRKRLYSMINDLPTVYEIVSEKKRDKTAMDSGNKSKLAKVFFLIMWFYRHFIQYFFFIFQRSSDGQVKSNSKVVDDGYGDEEDDEHSETLCGTCGGNYNGDEFWIGCDICERWFHGKCVKITPAKAESIKQYKCPNCSSKKIRQWSPNKGSFRLLVNRQL